MKTVKLNTPIGKSNILIGERLENLKQYLPINLPIIITDTNVQKHWGHHFPPGAVITIDTGEKIKTLDTVSLIYDKLLELDADRASFVVGIGGGIGAVIPVYTHLVVLHSNFCTSFSFYICRSAVKVPTCTIKNF